MRSIVALSGARAMVTGASSGLGHSLGVQLAKRGAVVVLVARRTSRLRPLAAHLRKLGLEAIAVPADISRVTEIRRLGAEVRRSLGGLDILINNAGVWVAPEPVQEIPPREWDRVLSTNLRAPALLCREFLGEMIRLRSGTIVNITSGTAECGWVGPYRISKVGLEVLTASVSEEVRGTGVSVFSFNPGWMRTEISDFGRSPSGPARELCKLLADKGRRKNGLSFDLVARGRVLMAHARRARIGRFGR